MLQRQSPTFERYSAKAKTDNCMAYFTKLVIRLKSNSLSTYTKLIQDKFA